MADWPRQQLEPQSSVCFGAVQAGALIAHAQSTHRAPSSRGQGLGRLRTPGVAVPWCGPPDASALRPLNSTSWALKPGPETLLFRRGFKKEPLVCRVSVIRGGGRRGAEGGGEVGPAQVAVRPSPLPLLLVPETTAAGFNTRGTLTLRHGRPPCFNLRVWSSRHVSA